MTKTEKATLIANCAKPLSEETKALFAAYSASLPRVKRPVTAR